MGQSVQVHIRYIVNPAVLLAVLAGCSTADLPSLERLPGPSDLPFIHRIDVQQGNVMTQDMLAQLRPQMDKKKVQFIMGTPVIVDTFNDDRWDYLYTFKPGHGDTTRRHITLVFVDEKLDHVEGDVTPAMAPLVADLHQDTTVRVPRLKKKPLLTRIKNKLPFTEEDREVAETDEEAQLTEAEKAELEAMFVVDQRDPVSPYDNIQAGPGEGVVVPPDAPTAGRKKGFFERIFGSVGLAADDDDDEEEFDPGDPKYRDITNQDDL